MGLSAKGNVDRPGMPQSLAALLFCEKKQEETDKRQFCG